MSFLIKAVKVFERTVEPYFPGKESLPSKKDPLYDRKMGDWWTDVVVNLDRVRERLNSNVTDLDEDIIKAKEDALSELKELQSQLEDMVANVQGDVSIMASSVSIMASSVSLAGGSLAGFTQLLNNITNQQYSN